MRIPGWRSILGGLLVITSATGVETVALSQPAVAGPALTYPSSSELSWGAGTEGELGNGTTTAAQQTPVAVSLPSGVTAITEIAAGNQNGYAIGSDGNVYSWGSGYTGQLGNGSTKTTQPNPVQVSLPSGVTATAIASAGETAYAVGSDGNLYAWGYGGAGQLGNGTTTAAQATPVTVSLPSGVTATAIAAGLETAFAIGSNGNLYAWGYGGAGELGNGTTTIRQTTPIQVSLPAGVTAKGIAAGSQTAYAIGSNGDVYAWGNGFNGQLGNGTTTATQPTPVAVSLPAGVTATTIAAGSQTGYAVGSDSNIYTWGYGGDGELGNDTTTTAQPTPVTVSLPAGVTATSIAAGSYTGYAIGSDSNVYAWGYGLDGELGNGTTTAAQPTPVTVSLPAGDVPTALGPEDQSETGYVVVYSQITLVQGSPTNATVNYGAGYTGQLSVTNLPTGGAPLTWATTTSSPNVSVSSSGAVTAPTTDTPGTYTVSGSVKDAYGDTGPWSFALTVNSTGSQVVITTTSLPDGTVGQPYSFQLEAIGGTPPYTWNKYPPKGNGTLPPWLHLPTSGLISGTPKRSGTFTLVVKCLDSSHSHKTQGVQQLTLTINP